MLYRQIALCNVKLFCFIVYENVGEVEILALYKKICVLDVVCDYSVENNSLLE